MDSFKRQNYRETQMKAACILAPVGEYRANLLENATGWSRTATKNGVRRKFWLRQEMTQELKRLPPAILYGPYTGELRIFGWHDKSGFARVRGDMPAGRP